MNASRFLPSCGGASTDIGKVGGHCRWGVWCVGLRRSWPAALREARAGRSAHGTGRRARSQHLDQSDCHPQCTVLEWRESDAGACLVTQAVLGVPASQLAAPALLRSWPSVVATVRALHGLATDRCPFDRGLGHMMSLAEASVAEGRVVVEPTRSSPRSMGRSSTMSAKTSTSGSTR